jgi:inner nuclear membrane protein Man1
MDNLELLSDDELRVKLLQYGFANLPITQTTRKTLIKKLRNHIAGQHESLRKSTSLVTRYSSGEDSDTLDGYNKTTKKKSRITVSGSPGGNNMPPPKSYSQPINRMSNAQTSPVLPRSSYNTSTIKKSSIYVSPVIINDSENEDNNSWKGISSQPKYSSRSSSFNNSNTAANSSFDSSSYKNGNNGYDDEDLDDSTTETTKRLLRFRQGITSNYNNNNVRKRTTPSYSTNPRDIVYHADTTLDSSSHRNIMNRFDFKHTFVPMALVASVILFFSFIIFFYFTISPNIENVLTRSTTSYVPCDDTGSTHCIAEVNIEPALTLLRSIAPEVQSRAIGYRCDRSVKSPLVCVRELGSLLTDESIFTNLYENTHNAEYLIDRNKQWGISNVNEKGETLDYDELKKLQTQQSECFTILDPKLPLSCRIKNKIQTYFTIIGSLSVIGTIVFLIWKFYLYVLKVKQRRNAKIDEIIKKICNYLMEKSLHDRDNSWVAVNHLRDKIIEPSKKSELTSVWIESIQFLEQNDSRIHFGVECINGEDFKVMRWIDEVKENQNLKQNTTKKYHENQQNFAMTKKWMGSAFDKSNKIKDPPTNCLKIRNMFDKYEASNSNIKTIITDTILQKLMERNCKIYDIQLDLKSCCVYVKCATTIDAGLVHEEINGQYLDNEIAVVKFLKEDKYHQRFPESIHANSILQPSSNVFVTKSDLGTNGHGHDDFYDDVDDDYD